MTASSQLRSGLSVTSTLMLVAAGGVTVACGTGCSNGGANDWAQHAPSIECDEDQPSGDAAPADVAEYLPAGSFADSVTELG